MKKSIATKWVEALRSGKYKQDTVYLKTSAGGYCCLGVLADIQEQPIKVNEESGLSNTENCCGLKSCLGSPFEGKDQSQVVIGKRKFRSLALANDSGVSFKRIATWIEKNYKKL